MQKAFEKILSRLDKKKQYFQKFYETEGKTKEDENLNKATQLAFDDAKSVVEEVSKEYEKYNRSETGFISRTEVLKLIEGIKRNDAIPKNYGTLLDILAAIRRMPDACLKE